MTWIRHMFDLVTVQGRWGKVHKGRWHGEVAIRLMEIDGNNQDHLKLFKKEVMNYRQTRHENVVLFMGACMAPPHLAIITRCNCVFSILLLFPNVHYCLCHKCMFILLDNLMYYSLVSLHVMWWIFMFCYWFDEFTFSNNIACFSLQFL